MAHGESSEGPRVHYQLQVFYFPNGSFQNKTHLGRAWRGLFVCFGFFKWGGGWRSRAFD